VRWLELALAVDREAVDAVVAAFAQQGVSVIIEEALLPGSGWGAWEPDLSRPVRLRGYLPAGRGARARLRWLRQALWHLSQLRPLDDLTVRTVDEADWAEAWKQHFPVLHVGQRLVIRPSWQPYTPAPAEVVIDLDPGMAFGTGLHPTTRLCLLALEQTVRPGNRVLDLGTGSGILALAAARLGAAYVLALDFDPVAVEVASRNVAANALSERITVQPGTIEQAPTNAFDLVVANISAEVLIASAAELARVTRPGGHALLSGLLDERETDVALAVAAAGFHLRASLAENDWRLIAAVRDTLEPTADPGTRGQQRGSAA
jgi:ribosomal protein L11 methyltransferase